MANRLVENVYIIDSQMGVGAGTGSATEFVQLQGINSSSWLSNAYISGIAFWGADTTSVLELALFSKATGAAANTTNIVIKMCPKAPVPATGNTQYENLGGVRFSELTTSTLTAGTGWIYFL